MFISPIDLVIVLVAVGFSGFYCWAQQRGLLTADPAAEGEAGTRRITLLAEAAAYAGVILLLVGGVYRDQPAMERHRPRGAGGRPRGRRRVLFPGRHHRAPGAGDDACTSGHDD